MAHCRWFPEAKPPQLMMQVGASVPDGPSFPFPAFAVWTENAPAKLRDQALDKLRDAARNAPWIEIQN